MAKHKAPGKSFRSGLSLIQIMDLLPNDAAATKWFESVMWPAGRCCAKCGATKTREVPNAKPMPYWCPDCRSYFSVRTGTALQRSKVPLRKWAIAIYLELTSLKSISSMKLHRDIEVTQSTAWFMLHRIRETWNLAGGFAGPIEVDETYVGGKRKNMPKAKRLQLEGRGAMGKTAVVGIKDRDTNKVAAQVVKHTDAETLHGFIAERTEADAKVYSDDAPVYDSLPFDHETVKHSIGEYVREQAHTNGIESFWAMLKRAQTGTFHKMSPKHLDRYVREFAGKHNIREQDTIDQMCHVAAGLVGKRLMYRQLVADNGLSSGAPDVN